MENAVPEKQSPFATEPIGRLIVKFAVPSVIALLVNSLYNIVDQIFIGNGVGYLGNGATNIVFPITIIALALAMMIGNGGAAFLSLKLGEGNVETAKKGVGNAVVLVTVVSIVLAAAADGSPDTPPVFRARKGLSENKALGFTLKEAKVMDGGAVWLRYTVNQ